jgi:hypothetical protein
VDTNKGGSSQEISREKISNPFDLSARKPHSCKNWAEDGFETGGAGALHGLGLKPRLDTQILLGELSTGNIFAVIENG